MQMLQLPYNYLLAIPIKTQFFIMVTTFFTLFVVVPLFFYLFRGVKAYATPIMFSYKHVLITGCGTGLGRALVQELYMRGAYITMVGREEEKLKQLKA